MSGIIYQYRPQVDSSETFSLASEMFSAIFGYICPLLSVVVIPALCVIVLVLSTEQLQSKKISNRIGALYDSFKLDSKMEVGYNLIFLWRRISLCLVSLFLQDRSSI